jgi:DedD protein
LFIGLHIGRATNGQSDQISDGDGLIAHQIEQDPLEDLLSRIEAASADATPESSLSFPAALPERGEPVPVMEAPEAAEDPAAFVEPGDAVPDAPLTSQAGDGETAATGSAPEFETVAMAEVPTDGWAVQLGAFKTLQEAEARVAELTRDSVPAYRVSALVRGETWYRVKVGGYATRDDALVGRDRLLKRLGLQTALVGQAP